jgi:hypothetical protein
MTLQRVKGTAPVSDIEFLLSDHMIRKGITIDDALVRTGQYTADVKLLKSGTVMAKVTATGLHGPVKKTTVSANAALGATDVVLTNAAFFQVNDSVIIGTEAAKVISAIDYGTNTITVTALVAAQAAGVTVKANNGLETADGILFNTTDVTDGDTGAAILTQAVVKEVRLIGSNALTKADLTKVEYR